jgi:dihydrofolate synthase/folylpolyglutamate synthase
VIDRLLALEFTGIKLGLENIGTLCRALDHPERSFESVHIAGTNGKGSVTAMVHEALLAAGRRSARYTSPHLSELRERFVIGADPVTAADLDAAGTDVLDLAERLVRTGQLPAPPTFFEATTAIGFELFRRAGVETAVVEVGLGGRFDATNILLPKVGAITSIGLDHQQYLGNTLASIAFEKAGIIKPGMAIITGALPEEAATVIAAVALASGARLVQSDAGTVVERTFNGDAAILRLTTPVRRYGPLTLGLRGEHQVGNAVVAVRVLEALSGAGTDVPGGAIEHGLTAARWPARLELIVWPDGKKKLLIDAAHNPDGARALAAYLAQWHSARLPLVIGLMRDKDVSGILEFLLPVTSAVIVTAAPSRRAMPADELAARVRQIDPDRDVIVEPNVGAALDRALERAPMACVAGSIFLAGAVRDVLMERAILR